MSWKRLSRPGGSPICVLVDGRVLFFEESWLTSGAAWLFDPIDDASREIARPPWRSYYPCATGTAEGWVAMVGGMIDHQPTPRCSVYEPATDTWHAMPAMPGPRKNHLHELINGRIYVLGGEPTPRAVWSWAPGEEWQVHPELPGSVEPGGLAARALADGSLVVWSTRNAGPLLRFDGQRWTELAALGAGVEVLATAEGLLAIGGLDEHAHATVRAWTPTGWTDRPALPRPRGGATALRLAEGRVVVLGGRRYDHYLEDSSTGGELDYEYRSFSTTKVYGKVDCTDLELETPTGWVSLPAEPFDLAHPLADGRLLVVQRYVPRDYFPYTYLWTPPPFTSG